MTDPERSRGSFEFDVRIRHAMTAAMTTIQPSRQASPTPVIALAVLALGVVCSGVACLLHFRLIADIGAAPALTVTFLVPVFGVLWGTCSSPSRSAGTRRWARWSWSSARRS